MFQIYLFFKNTISCYNCLAFNFSRQTMSSWHFYFLPSN